MSVLVYPRLASLLQARNLTPADLGRQIEVRFGLPVTPRTLQPLTQASPIQRADLEVAGAAAAVLGVELGDIFAVEATPVSSEGQEPGDDDLLDPAQSRRLRALHDRQATALLDDAEWVELAELVSVFGHRLHERRMRELAAQRGIPVAQAEREAAEQLTEALDWWREVQADPARLQSLIEEAQRQATPLRAAGSGG